ncbi:MAG: hypothetical protein ACRBDL_06840 [Alphaproteobacteria bacterium]
MQHFRVFLVMLAACPVLVSCGEVVGFKVVSAGLLAASHGVFARPDVNLKEKNYAAADFLISQVSSSIDTFDVIEVVPLEEMDHAGVSSPFGHAVPEGVGLRFSELGYHVDLHKVSVNDPSSVKVEKVSFRLRGTYAVKAKQVDVYLRMMDVHSGQIVGRFDYSMPLSAEIRKLSQTQTRIFKVK